MIKNLFLDRDGIVNEVVLREGVVGSPRSMKEFIFKNDFIDFVSRMKNYKLKIFIVSNQPDVARGLMIASVLEEINKQILELHPVQEIVYCLHDNADNCYCRKPKPGMIISILQKYGLNKDECLLIGDSRKDIEAANAAQIKCFLLKTNYNNYNSIECDHKISHLTDIFNHNLIKLAS